MESRSDSSVIESNWLGGRDSNPIATNESNYFIKSNDATYAGEYSYPAEAINASCEVVRLELFSEKQKDKANTKTLDKKTVARIIADFQPYFRNRQ